MDLMNLLKIADENNVYDEDQMKALTSMINVSTETSAEAAATQENKTCNRKDATDWIFMDQFTLRIDHWDILHVGYVLDSSYVQYFTSVLNSNHNISCVLKARGPYVAYNLFNMRFKCTIKPCQREYKVSQIHGTHFKIYRNAVEEVHELPRAPQVRGINREICSKGLTKMNTAKYMMFCEKGINRTLYERGHLQDFISVETAQQMRTIALQQQDFDKDDIVDILKMKILADTEFKKCNSVSDVFIRRITLDPFIVLMYSNAQLKLMKDLSDADPELPLFLDATGNVGRHGGKRIYYYAGVVRVKKNRDNEKEKARLQPAIEFISGEHDAFNIRLQLEEIMKDFQAKYPTHKWPFRYTVTDFSFALLNAISRAWNCMKLITYINLTYLVADKQIDLSDLSKDFDIVTFLQLCCGHFSKTFANDVSKYFPNMSNDNQKILKEVFAGMIDIDNLDTLRTIYINLSTLFRSKFVNEDVELALKNLIDIMGPPKRIQVEDDEDEEEDDDDEGEMEETRLPDDTHEHEAMYMKSSYYQDLLKATYKPQFEVAVKPQNAFYCVEFSTMFLKKYISILPLWTSIIVKSRRSNGPVESHFKNKKSTLKHKEPEIGALPLKCGRLCREIEEYTKYTTTVSALGVPRKNNCYEQTKKRKNESQDGQQRAKKFKESDKILSLYKYAPKQKTPRTPRTPRTPKTPQNPTTPASLFQNQRTPTGSKTNPRKHKLDFDQIDDENVEEEWYRRRKNEHAHKRKETLTKLQNSSDDPSFRSILEKAPNSISNNNVPKSRNGLIDDPETYVKPTRDFVVSRIGKVLLHNDIYKTLFGTGKIGDALLVYMASLFSTEAKTFQFETTVAVSKIIENSTVKPIPKIKKSIVIGILLNGLVIINCKNKTFSYIDPNDKNDQMEYFEAQI